MLKKKAKPKPKPKKNDKDDIPIKQVKVGRPSKFDKSLPSKAAKLAKAGARDEDIAKTFGIAISTLNEWKKKYPQFSESLKGAKEVIDKKVVCALLKNALGYSITETKRAYRPLFKPNGEPILDDQGHQMKALLREEVTTKEVQPSTVAQIFWLKNRQPDKWRDAFRLMDNEKEKGEVIDLFNRMKGEDAGST